MSVDWLKEALVLEHLSIELDASNHRFKLFFVAEQLLPATPIN